MISVLHIEDDTDILELVQMGLSLEADMAVVQATHGAEGLDLAKADTPDIILLDYMMPGLSGPETFEKLREIESLSATPIAFVTARTTQKDEELMRNLGAVAVLRKPFDPLAIAGFIREHTSKSAALYAV